jgi:membrane-associated progesterone receptor component
MSPLNLSLLSLLLFLLYLRFFRPRRIPTMPLEHGPAPILFRSFTPAELIAFNGSDPKKPILFAVNRKVFDVTPGRNFYGPGGPYENFAGRDASRGLACGSFSSEMLTLDLEADLDTLETLTSDQRDALRNWEEKFDEKYTVVGELVSVGEKRAKKE